MRVVLRYDLRAPLGDPGRATAQVRVALEQVEWADRVGCAAVIINEHHGTEDGYLPSPLVFAAAVSQRTSSLRINPAAVIAPLYDPLRLAEDAAVVDLLSSGRLTLTLGAGYATHEFEMFGKKLSDRFRALETSIDVLRAAWTGEPFAFEGRRVRVTPRPHQPSGPPILLGGVSEGAARRAARIADGFVPVHPALHDTYRESCVELGRPDPGPAPRSGPRFLYISDDPDAAWRELAPYLLHETNSYSEWGARAGIDNGYRAMRSGGELRTSPNHAVVTPDECVALARALGDGAQLVLHPLCGGMDPDLSWRSLDLFERAVLPRLGES